MAVLAWLAGCRPQLAEPAPALVSAPASVSAPSASSAPSSGVATGLACTDGRIFFTSERTGHRQIFEMCPDGSRVERRFTSPSNDHVAAVSPSGTLAVLSITGNGGEPGYREKLQLFDGSLHALGEGRARLRNPSFLSGGRALVIEADVGGMSNLARLTENGRLEVLTRDEHGAFEPTVAPDGKTLAFVSSRDGDAEIYRMSVGGTELLRLTRSRGDDTAPCFSPDGERIAFSSSRRGAVRIHVMNADGSRPRVLDQEEVLGETEATWSPDGQSLAYIAVRASSASLRIVNARDGSLLVEDRGAFRDETPSFSPDGRWVVFASNRDGDVELYAIPSSGGAVTRVTRSPGVDFLPRWLPAGK